MGLRVVGAHHSVTKVRGSRCDWRLVFMSLLTGMDAVSDRLSTVRGYVRMLTLFRAGSERFGIWQGSLFAPTPSDHESGES